VAPSRRVRHASNYDDTEMCLPLTLMNSEGKARADEALTKIDPGDSSPLRGHI